MDFFKSHFLKTLQGLQNFKDVYKDSILTYLWVTNLSDLCGNEIHFIGSGEILYEFTIFLYNSLELVRFLI